MTFNRRRMYEGGMRKGGERICCQAVTRVKKNGNSVHERVFLVSQTVLGRHGPFSLYFGPYPVTLQDDS